MFESNCVFSLTLTYCALTKDIPLSEICVCVWINGPEKQCGLEVGTSEPKGLGQVSSHLLHLLSKPKTFQDLLLVLLIWKMGNMIYICRDTLKIRNYTHLNILCQMLKSSMSMHITKGINAWISTLILWDHFK